ncbi:hypothetical protein GGE46_004498 [Rhizobium etli]|uniref:HIT domain-containing protein n=1 Tax=Rhizobium etli TaxID=29449 RepID=A0A7W6VCX8_RHIET|nr:hypothetical protein [Rhizobium etli]MBB4537725.1 hypothetical protein [Rhizobium etli]
MNDRHPFDLETYLRDIAIGPCFICGLVKGDPAFFHHRIFEDEETIIFLSKYPTLPGYCLVCPREHREDLARDMSTDEYLRLQEKVHVLSRALKSVFNAERITFFHSAASRLTAICIFTSFPCRRACLLRSSNTTR